LLTEKPIRRGMQRSVDEFEAAIERFCAYNTLPK
jgi:hypothetical protein